MDEFSVFKFSPFFIPVHFSRLPILVKKGHFQFLIENSRERRRRTVPNFCLFFPLFSAFFSLREPIALHGGVTCVCKNTL